MENFIESKTIMKSWNHNFLFSLKYDSWLFALLYPRIIIISYDKMKTITHVCSAFYIAFPKLNFTFLS